MQTNTNVWADENIVKVVASGGVVVMPTDTIYGMLCSALDTVAVNKVYDIRHRTGEKPCIILIADISELKKFNIEISSIQDEVLNKYWMSEGSTAIGSRPVSIVLDCHEEKFEYLHRGTNTLAFRLPHGECLRDLLLKTGPLIAPSANIEKFPQSESVEDAKAYFGDKVDLYVDAGPVVNRASKVVRLHPDGTETVLRA